MLKITKYEECLVRMDAHAAVDHNRRCRSPFKNHGMSSLWYDEYDIYFHLSKYDRVARCAHVYAQVNEAREDMACSTFP